MKRPLTAEGTLNFTFRKAENFTTAKGGHFTSEGYFTKTMSLRGAAPKAATWQSPLKESLIKWHTETKMDVIASQCAHWRGNPFSLSLSERHDPKGRLCAEGTASLWLAKDADRHTT